MTVVLDAGAFLAVERADRRVVALLAREHRAGRIPVTHGGVVGQVWRGHARQARLARLLGGVIVASIDAELGRAAGVLLAQAGAADVVDAAVILLASDGDEILTSDPGDLAMLAAAGGLHADIIGV